jgi:hypothetical protein
MSAMTNREVTNKFLTGLKRSGPKKAFQSLFNTGLPVDQLVEIVDEAKQYVSSLNPDSARTVFAKLSPTVTKLPKTSLSGSDLEGLKNDELLIADTSVFMIKNRPVREVAAPPAAATDSESTDDDDVQDVAESKKPVKSPLQKFMSETGPPIGPVAAGVAVAALAGRLPEGQGVSKSAAGFTLANLAFQQAGGLQGLKDMASSFLPDFSVPASTTTAQERRVAATIAEAKKADDRKVSETEQGTAAMAGGDKSELEEKSNAAPPTSVPSSSSSSLSSEPPQGPSYGSAIPLPLEPIGPGGSPEEEVRTPSYFEQGYANEILLRRTKKNKAFLRKRTARLETAIDELADQAKRGAQSQEGADLLIKLRGQLEALYKNPGMLVPSVDDKRIRELDNYILRLNNIEYERPEGLTIEENDRLEDFKEELKFLEAGLKRSEVMSEVLKQTEVVAKTKRRAERYAPSMSREQIREIEIEESARKKARFQQLEQRQKTGPKRLELIAAARNQAGVDPVPGLALGNVPGLVGNVATSRLAIAAMYNPSGQEAAAFRANQIFPNDANNLNQGPGPRRSFAQQIPTGLNGQPAYEDASVSNARISPLVQSILVPNYTPPVASQPAQGRLAQRAWDNYVTDITALGYATRR